MEFRAKMFKISSYLGDQQLIIARNGTCLQVQKTSSDVAKRFMATLFFCEQTNLKAD
jgi:hypothetical protein